MNTQTNTSRKLLFVIIGVAALIGVGAVVLKSTKTVEEAAGTVAEAQRYRSDKSAGAETAASDKPADKTAAEASTTTETAPAAANADAAAKAHSNNQGLSDSRLKRQIHRLAILANGLQIYSFKYLWSDKTYVGVMAQDLLKNPLWRGAVVKGSDGYYAVDYARLGLKMTSLDEWQSRGVAAVELQR